MLWNGRETFVTVIAFRIVRQKLIVFDLITLHRTCSSKLLSCKNLINLKITMDSHWPDKFS